MKTFKDLQNIKVILEKDRKLIKAQANCNIFAFVVLAVSIILYIAKIIGFNELIALATLIIIAYLGFEVYFKLKADSFTKTINKILKA